jgi:hypothetical protein
MNTYKMTYVGDEKIAGANFKNIEIYNMENLIMRNISTEDYVIWDSTKGCPVDPLDVVYHYTTLVELVNDGFTLEAYEQFVCVAGLPIVWQEKISQAIQKTK